MAYFYFKKALEYTENIFAFAGFTVSLTSLLSNIYSDNKTNLQLMNGAIALVRASYTTLFTKSACRAHEANDSAEACVKSITASLIGVTVGSQIAAVINPELEFSDPRLSMGLVSVAGILLVADAQAKLPAFPLKKFCIIGASCTNLLSLMMWGLSDTGVLSNKGTCINVMAANLSMTFAMLISCSAIFTRNPLLILSAFCMFIASGLSALQEIDVKESWISTLSVLFISTGTFIDMQAASIARTNAMQPLPQNAIEMVIVPNPLADNPLITPQQPVLPVDQAAASPLRRLRVDTTLNLNSLSDITSGSLRIRHLQGGNATTPFLLEVVKPDVTPLNLSATDHFGDSKEKSL